MSFYRYDLGSFRFIPWIPYYGRQPVTLHSSIRNPQSEIRNRKSAIELLGGVPEDGRDSPVMGGIGENLFDVAACFTERNTLYKLRQVDVSKIFQLARRCTSNGEQGKTDSILPREARGREDGRNSGKPRGVLR